MVDTNSLAMMDPNSRRRVKLYMLNAERMWDDRGTGYISSMYVEKFRGMCLLVRSEDDGTVLMESKINLHTAYQKQQDTLIVWSEQANDFALSFQEKAGCDEIWEKICQEQGCNPSVNITKEVPIDPSDRGDEPNIDDDPNMDEIPDASQLAANTPIPLPTCELSKLEEIQDFISNYVMLPVHTERLAVSIENEQYIKKLLDLFHVCEDLEHKEGLTHLYEIFSNILKLNKNALYEIMFAEDTIFDVIGVLEYNPAKLSPRIKHREFLRTQANFKEVIPLSSSGLVQRIHQLYRIQYIQDVILPTPTVFEETMLSTLTSYIFFMKAEIVTQIQEDKHFLQTLFSQILDDEVDEEKQRDLVLFLKEFCVFSQSLQPNCKELFFKSLINYGVLGAIEIVLGLDDAAMKNAALDIFSFVLECNPSNVREFIMQEAAQSEDEDLLINLVLEQMISDVDPELGGAVQLMGIIRLLVDPENMLGTTNKTEKSEFLNFFYKHSMHVLTAPLFANTADVSPSKDDYQTAQLLSIILELLTFCIERHGYHVRNYVLQKDLIRRVLVLLRSQHAFLALAALRLVRRVVGLKDEFYNRYLVKGDLFAPIVVAFKANGDKYNLLNSAMIELFDFIRVDDNKTLITYVVETHYKEFEGVEYVQTFKQLKKKYEDAVNGSTVGEKPTFDSTPSLLRNNRLRRDARSLEEEEEMWFDNDDDFEESDNIMPMSEMLKSRDAADYDNFEKINKYLERNRHLSEYGKENDSVKASPPRLHSGGMGGTISINLNRSPTPPDSPEGSPILGGAPLTSPANSPIASAALSPVSPLSDRSNSPSPPTTPTTPATSTAPTTGSSSASSPPPPPAADSPATTTTPSSSSAVTTKKPGIVGLVDYPDEDSEEEDEDNDSGIPSSKRPRLST